MKIIITITLLLVYSFSSSGQIKYPTSDAVHIFWQPGLKITYKDYNGVPQKYIEEMMKQYSFTASASVGIWSVLDIPKKKKDRYKKFEKIYFAPAFERTTSFCKTNDSVQIEMQNLYLDICEVWARWARQKLSAIQDSVKATGILTIMYMTVKQEMDEKKLYMYRSYFKDVIIDKKDGSFNKWKKLIDTLLADTIAWATTAKECYRLMSKQPVETGYIQAPTVTGPL